MLRFQDKIVNFQLKLYWSSHSHLETTGKDCWGPSVLSSGGGSGGDVPKFPIDVS